MLNSFAICYHGTTDVYAESILDNIDIKRGRTFTDFGQGFYVTSNYQQARQWAQEKAKDYTSGIAKRNPAVIKFALDTSSLQSLQGITFNQPTDRWAQFVYNCRKVGKTEGLYHTQDYVCGPLADGRFILFFNRLSRGQITPKEFRRSIMPFSKHHNQLSLHTLTAIRCISPLEVELFEELPFR